MGSPPLLLAKDYEKWYDWLMNKDLLEVSYALRKRRQERITRVVSFVLLLFVSVSLVKKFLVFSVEEKSLSMQSDIPVLSRLFLTPIVGTPERGDVLAIKRLDARKAGALHRLLDEAVRFITAQRLSLSDMGGFMGEHDMLRRVVALPGDTIYMKGNVVFVKPKGEDFFLTEFERTAKPYNVNITALPALWDVNMGVKSSMEEVTLSDDEYFVLGDNRDSAIDCRMWGAITRGDIKAKALCVYFPFGKMRLL